MKLFAAIRAVFVFFGLAMLALAGTWFFDTLSFAHRAVVGQGVIVELTTSRSSRSISTWPVVEFSTPDGKPVRFQSSMGSNPPSYEVGERVEVLYEESRPEKAEIHSFVSLWLKPVVMGTMGFLFIAMGFVLVFLRGRRESAS